MNNIPTISIYQPIPSAPPPIVLPASLSYEFRVVELIKDGKIEKVGLQVKCNQHDQYGNINIHGMWEDVPREQINME